MIRNEVSTSFEDGRNLFSDGSQGAKKTEKVGEGQELQELSQVVGRIHGLGLRADRTNEHPLDGNFKNPS